MTQSSPFESMQSATKAKSQVLRHSKTDNNIRFLRAVAVLADCCEADADKPLVVNEFREEIDVQRLNRIVKDYQPVVAVFYLTHGPRHFYSIRKIAS